MTNARQKYRSGRVLFRASICVAAAFVILASLIPMASCKVSAPDMTLRFDASVGRQPGDANVPEDARSPVDARSPEDARAPVDSGESGHGVPATDASSVSVAPASLDADGASVSTITVVLRDKFHDPVVGKAVAIAVSGTGNTLSTAAPTN